MKTTHQLNISLDNPRLKTTYGRNFRRWRLVAQQQFHTRVVAQIAADAALVMVSMTGDVSFIHAFFIERHDFGFVSGPHTLVKVIALG